MQSTAKISKKGQIVIPSKLRKLLNLNEGDELLFKESDNKLVVEKLELPTQEEWLALLEGIPTEQVSFDEKGQYDPIASPGFHEWMNEEY